MRLRRRSSVARVQRFVHLTKPETHSWCLTCEQNVGDGWFVRLSDRVRCCLRCSTALTTREMP